jgi:hypothetical protein
VGEPGADAAATVRGPDGGAAAVGAGDLGVPEQAVALGDADGPGADVEARALPVTDDVGQLELRPA